jgi:hypothetical protein
MKETIRLYTDEEIERKRKFVLSLFGDFKNRPNYSKTPDFLSNDKVREVMNEGLFYTIPSALLYLAEEKEN